MSVRTLRAGLLKSVGSDAIIRSSFRDACGGETEMGNARKCLSKSGAGTIGRTYRTSALFFRTANLEIW